MVLEFEKERLIHELKIKNPKKVLVQLPEGIKKNAFEISEIIEKLGIECVFSGESAWGGCSVAKNEAMEQKADLIVHFGHAEFMKVNFPTIYIEIKDKLNIKKLEKLLLDSLKKIEEYKKIGLSYAIQNRDDVQFIKKFYESKNKKIILSKKLGFVISEGHIVGCQYKGLKEIEKEVDCFLVLGNRFHSMGAAVAVKKPVILIDTYNNEVKEMGSVRETIIKQRAIAIDKFKESNKIGVIKEKRFGQEFGSAEKILDLIKKNNKKGIVITMLEITPEKMMNFYDIEAFVNLACPRISIDDFHKYHKPLLTLKEALVALGEKSWKELLKEGII